MRTKIAIINLISLYILVMIPTAILACTDVRVDTFNLGYSPDQEEVAAGSTAFQFNNSSDTIHNVIINRQSDGYNLKKAVYSSPIILPDGTHTFTVDLSPGKHVMWCSVGRHLIEGMHKTFTVYDPGETDQKQ